MTKTLIESKFNPTVNHRGHEKCVLDLRNAKVSKNGSLKLGRLVLVVHVGYVKKIQFEVSQDQSGIDHISGLAEMLRKKLRKTHAVEIGRKRQSGFLSDELITITPFNKEIIVRDKLRLAQKMARVVERCVKKTLPATSSRPM